MARMSDNTSAELEDEPREAGYNYPIAWALSFLVDNRGTIEKALTAYDDPGLAKTLNQLCTEIRTGVVR